MPSPSETLESELIAEIAPLLVPVPGEAPAGVDPGLDSDFELIKRELDKLVSVDGIQPNWALIETTAGRILSERGKDLRVASWLAAARVNTRGFRGFASGVLLVRGLVDRYWETMSPEVRRVRGRANAYGWLTEQAFAKLETIELKAADADSLRLAERCLLDLDAVLAEKFGDTHPGPGRLRGLFRSKSAAVQALASASASAPAPSPAAPQLQAQSSSPSMDAPSAATSPPTPAPAAKIVAEVAVTAPPAEIDLSQVDDALTTCTTGIRKVAAAIREGDPTLARSYRLLRAGLWLSIEAPPPAVRGQTRFKPPDRTTAERMPRLAASSHWPELLEAAEHTSAQYTYWLDPHRFAATAMDQLGPSYARAREEVGRAVVDFCRRVPGVEGLTFSNGTPFADAATVRWLESEREKWAGGGPKSGGNGPPDPLAEALEKAKELLKEGNLGEALAAANEGAVRSGSHRDRFRGLLQTARMAMDSGAVSFAKAILDGLLRDVETYSLEEWDPVLCAALYKALLVAMRAERGAANTGNSGSSGKPGTNVEALAREATIFEKLCRIDPRTALELARG